MQQDVDCRPHELPSSEWETGAGSSVCRHPATSPASSSISWYPAPGFLRQGELWLSGCNFLSRWALPAQARTDCWSVGWRVTGFANNYMLEACENILIFETRLWTMSSSEPSVKHPLYSRKFGMDKDFKVQESGER